MTADTKDKLEQVLAEEMEASLLGAADWRAVFEWCRETGVEFYLKPVLEDNPGLELKIQRVEAERLVTREETVAFREIEWIKVPFTTPFLGKSQPDLRPYLRARGIPFEERPNGIVVRGPMRKLKTPT